MPFPSPNPRVPLAVQQALSLTFLPRVTSCTATPQTSLCMDHGGLLFSFRNPKMESHWACAIMVSAQPSWLLGRQGLAALLFIALLGQTSRVFYGEKSHHLLVFHLVSIYNSQQNLCLCSTPDYSSPHPSPCLLRPSERAVSGHCVGLSCFELGVPIKTGKIKGFAQPNKRWMNEFISESGRGRTLWEV